MSPSRSGIHGYNAKDPQQTLVSILTASASFVNSTQNAGASQAIPKDDLRKSTTLVTLPVYNSVAGP